MHMAAESVDTGGEVHVAPVWSFDELYRREYAGIVRLLVVLTGRRDVAEELTQDAFLVVHRRWATISTYERPDAFVRRIAINRAVSVARRKSTEARLMLRVRREPVQEMPWTTSTSEIWDAIRALPARQAQVAALVLIEDRSIQDAAEILGCGQETVKSHLRRARAALTSKIGATSHA
jgi:RNA polymerase sigma factor (sigma-70 family)